MKCGALFVTETFMKYSRDPYIAVRTIFISWLPIKSNSVSGGLIIIEFYLIIMNVFETDIVFEIPIELPVLGSIVWGRKYSK